MSTTYVLSSLITKPDANLPGIIPGSKSTRTSGAACMADLTGLYDSALACWLAEVKICIRRANSLLELLNGMNHLWSPWRMEYIENHGKVDGCVFCRAVMAADSSENLIVHRGQLAFVILNRYPYTSGHVMVVPFEHKPNLEQLDAATRGEMMELTSHATTVLRNIYNTQAFNVGLNIGEAAGAGVKEHVHIHVVPRWNGDTNFMSSLAETRVLPELLQDTWTRIRMGFRG